MKKIKHNKNSISFSFFRSISMTSILFMVLLFLGISGLFLKHSFRLEGRNALQQLSYISGQFQYYLDATENYSKTILSDDTILPQSILPMQQPMSNSISDRSYSLHRSSIL